MHICIGIHICIIHVRIFLLIYLSFCPSIYLHSNSYRSARQGQWWWCFNLASTRTEFKRTNSKSYPLHRKSVWECHCDFSIANIPTFFFLSFNVHFFCCCCVCDGVCVLQTNLKVLAWIRFSFPLFKIPEYRCKIKCASASERANDRKRERQSDREKVRESNGQLWSVCVCVYTFLSYHESLGLYLFPVVNILCFFDSLLRPFQTFSLCTNHPPPHTFHSTL